MGRGDGIEMRIRYFDSIRVVSVLMAIMIHVSMIWWDDWQPTSANWIVANFFNSCSRYGVPLLVMLSGALIVTGNEENTSKTVYRIFRILKAYIVWSALYATEFIVFEDYSGNPVWEFIKQFVMGHYHLWFCYMIVGLYLFLPFANHLCKEKKLLEYFLLLWSVFAIILPAVEVIGPLDKISVLLEKMRTYFPMGYTGYWLLGYWIIRYGSSVSNRHSALIWGGLALICTMGTFYGTLYLSNRSNSGVSTLYDYFMPLVALGAISIFKLFQICNLGSEMASEIAKNSFAIYLMSDFGVIALRHLANRHTLLMRTSMLIPIYALVIFFICNYLVIIFQNLVCRQRK